MDFQNLNPVKVIIALSFFALIVFETIIVLNYLYSAITF